MTDPATPRDLTRNTLGVLFLVLLAFASLWILRPFLLPTVWAATVVISTWPLLLAVQARLWGKRWLAVSVMVAMLLLVFLIPASAAVAVVLANTDSIAAVGTHLREMELPQPPEWVSDLPMIGESIAAGWARLASAGPQGLGSQVAPYAAQLGGWLLEQLGRFGMLLVDFFLTALLAGILYARGEVAGAAVRRFAGRLAGPRGEEATDLAGRAIRSVALGVVLTALLQALVGGIGLAIAGVPVVGLLTGLMFLFAVAQIGAGPVMAIATIGLFIDGQTGSGVLLAVWTVVVASMDNVVRPLLIRRGAHLPLLLIFAGVLGGLVAFGVIGIFVGPVLLAVTYTLLGAWVGGTEAVAVRT